MLHKTQASGPVLTRAWVFLLSAAFAWVLLLAGKAFANPVKPDMPMPEGRLLIVGGGDTPVAVQERFVELAGGSGVAKVAVLPMASTEFDEEAGEVIADLQRLGVEAELLLIAGDELESDAAALRIADYSGYWFIGGDQSRLADALRDSRVLGVLHQRYMEGAVIGGTSAGASVMSSMMLTGRLKVPDDAEEAEMLNIARGVMDLSIGFGFIKGAIVDQHFMSRARYNRLISAVLDHPLMLGVGIDEETALLVHPDGTWEVLGNNYVKIFDAYRALVIDDEGPMAKASDIRMHVLPEGSLFNSRSRKVSFPGSQVP
jgi:cyanophycinase